MTEWWQRWLHYAGYLWRRPVPRNALQVALPVGAVLNLINQGHALFGSEPVSWGQFAFNFIVPYSVASWSAARSRYLTERANKQTESASDPRRQ